ncbi:MAG TPA: quaternary ammonium compound efflux SMR transporter SugE [Phycisphaerales bacterium]|nr:quaternary ammonium compound efflux SMR transporter SugE [Phycisphaerales bacterium]
MNPTTAWIILVIAGLLEVAWAIGLKYTHGFTRLWPSVATIAAIIVSMYLLSLAARTLPIGTAYAVWVGIGAAGTAVLGMLILHEPATLGRVFFLVLMGVAIVGLKLTAPTAAGTP